MNIELRHLRYFLAVADELHFGRAAEKLNISQPPLSQQIQALEAHTGALLFERNNRNVRLTPAGEMFRQEAQSILNQVELATERAARIQRGEVGELRIGFTSSAPFIHTISRSLIDFRRRYPGVHIQMLERHSKRQVDLLLHGKIDIGVMRNNPLPDSLHHQLLLYEALVAVVHEDHPLAGETSISIRQLASEPFVFFSREVGTALYDEILLLLKRYDIAPYITQEVGEALTIVGLVSAGLGVSLLPASFTRIIIGGVKYLPLQEPDAITEVWLVTARHRASTMAIQALTSLMMEQEEDKFVR